ncbi:hypothetical protein Q8F55_005973 [Vanrija albida]|uniref:Uncharacterized protein n=1 Tax=Vanrija albida TaxID=181172 RepID=A0ABR3Q346_9TREE
MIVEGCDIDSMRALRTTSTAFRTRMDSLLNLHVELVLNQESKGLYMLLSGPRGSSRQGRRLDST